MAMRRYMAIHTFHSEQTKRAVMKWAAENKATQREFMAGQVFDKCRTLATWLGNDDFFFCHWEAEDEQDIHNALAENGLDKFVVTACYRAHSHIDTKNLTGEIRNYPPWVD